MPSVTHLVPALFDAREGIIGGAERYAHQLALSMTTSCPTRLVTFGDRAREERDGNLTIQVLGDVHRIRGQHHNPFSWQLRRALSSADVIHCHQHHVVASTFAAIFGRMTAKRVFATDLGGAAWDLSGYVSTDRLFHGHLHISQFSRIVNGQQNYDAASVIYGGVDTARFSPGATIAREGEVLFVGRILPHKGIDYLIEATHPETPLRIIGQPYDKNYLELLKSLARGKRVVWDHGCSDTELVSAYRRAACVVLPSVYRSRYGHHTLIPELLGQTLLEAMACGTAVVCTDVGSMPEIVTEDVGIVVPPNDVLALGKALRQLTENPDLAGQLGAAGRRRVEEHFTWATVVRRCLDAYAGLPAKRTDAVGG